MKPKLDIWASILYWIMYLIIGATVFAVFLLVVWGIKELIGVIFG